MFSSLHYCTTSLFLYVVLKGCQLHNHDVVHDVAYITLLDTDGQKIALFKYIADNCIYLGILLML